MSTPGAPRSGTLALINIGSGRVYSLRTGPNAIGRSRKNPVALGGREVSRRHAVLTVRAAGECELSDEGSRNGTFLNGARVEGVSYLVPGDIIQICGVLLLFVRNDGLWRLALPTGTFAWDTADDCWHGAVELVKRRFVCVTYAPPDRAPVPGRDREDIRNWLIWLHFGGAELWSRFRTSRCLGDLTHLLLAGERATLIFGERNGALCVTIDRTGRPVSDPVQVEERDDSDR